MQIFCVTLSLVVRPTLTTDGFGIFSVHTNLDRFHTHEEGSGTNKSAQELTWKDRKTVLPYQAIEPSVYGLEL